MGLPSPTAAALSQPDARASSCSSGPVQKRGTLSRMRRGRPRRYQLPDELEAPAAGVHTAARQRFDVMRCPQHMHTLCSRAAPVLCHFSPAANSFLQQATKAATGYQTLCACPSQACAANAGPIKAASGRKKRGAKPKYVFSTAEAAMAHR